MFELEKLKEIASLNILANKLEKEKLILTSKILRKFIKEYIEINKWS